MKKLGLDPATINMRDRQPRPQRSFRRREIPPGSLQRTACCSAPRTGTCSIAAPARSRSAIMVATDGQKLTLGDTTVTLYKTPGHTLGTLSTLIPVTDNGTPHVAASWGGTAFNWMAQPHGLHHARSTGALLVRNLQCLGAAVQGTGGEGRRRRVDLEPHDLRRIEDEDARARTPQARRSESVRDRQGRRAALSDGGRRMRAGRARASGAIEERRSRVITMIVLGTDDDRSGG